ncbi:zinc finger BED domain-containing protein 5 [Elysia marginata]|uniref:Zinc finger BED domain-containing protein 5 n=1 Tax=Elysia marginata TaxID=1093978 RepID=A0AAV4ITJ2_9GAST|nr:zinc finger BED domain-containing protein 5 [Elysia marginata]
MFTGFLVEHNIPIAAADHVGKLLKAMFPAGSSHSADEVIKNYACGRTKSFHIIRELAARENSSLASLMAAGPYKLCIDGSNDKGEKLFPFVVRISDGSTIKTQLLALLELKERSTGRNIAALIETALSDRSIPITNCVAITTDNANNMIGANRGAFGHLKEIHPNLIATGCICHRLHLASERAAKELPTNVENFLIDFYYYMEKSSLRLKAFEELQAKHRTPLTKVAKQCPTRWLSIQLTCD